MLLHCGCCASDSRLEKTARKVDRLDRYLQLLSCLFLPRIAYSTGQDDGSSPVCRSLCVDRSLCYCYCYSCCCCYCYCTQIEVAVTVVQIHVCVKQDKLTAQHQPAPPAPATPTTPTLTPTPTPAAAATRMQGNPASSTLLREKL